MIQFEEKLGFLEVPLFIRTFPFKKSNKKEKGKGATDEEKATHPTPTLC